MSAEILVRATAHIAIGLYAVVVFRQFAFATWDFPNTDRQDRAIWTAGAAVILAHMTAALLWSHDGSWAKALEHTAFETKRVTGIALAEGIYGNLAFAVLWGADLAWWWLWPASHRTRTRWVGSLLHGYLALVVVNGAIVFARGPMCWVWLAVACGIAVVALRRMGLQNGR